jgi:nickel-dependent lactate racemase
MNPNVKHAIRIGQKTHELTLPDNAVMLGYAGSPDPRAVGELLREAISAPIEFPELALAILEEDLVAIALEEAVPQGFEIVAELVQWLLERPLRGEQITVVLSSADRNAIEQARDAIDRRSPGGGGVVRIVQHAASNHDQLEYIAAAKSADPIYIQRDLVEAAVVLPIYCIREPDTLSASDPYAMSPAFADAKTQQRWRLAWLDDNQQHLHQQSKLSREAGWLMGVQFAVAVVPASDGRITAIVAGDPQRVHQSASEQLREQRAKGNASPEDQEQRFELAIAAIDGGAEQQTWLNVARAVARADEMLHPTGRIIVCCDIERITDGVAQLASDDPDEQLEKELLGGNLQDAFPAAVLRSIQARRSIYLMAPISESEMEPLGIAYASKPSDIERLAQGASSVVLIHSAHL